VTSDLEDGALTVIDTGTARVLRTINVSGSRDPFQVTILWSPDGRRIYVAETATDTVAEVDYASGRVLRRLKVGVGGDGLAIIDWLTRPL
jgi:YVTN family beta-propeller protein